MFRDRMDRFFSSLEWRWSLANLLWGAGALASATLPAWAVATMDIFAGYAPLSWIMAGFSGFLLFCAGFYVYAIARQRVVQSRYDSRALEKGGNANPMEKVFERKRVFLNEFALPSTPLVIDKNFIDCEIIGPANIFLVSGNRIDDTTLPNCDAVVVRHDNIFNCYRFINCSFRRCSFQRVTFYISKNEYEHFASQEFFNWISFLPDGELPLLSRHEAAKSVEGSVNDDIV